MLRRFSIPLLVFISALGVLPAQAADLPSLKPPPPTAPVFTWTSFHVGSNRGFGGGVIDSNVTLLAPGLGGVATRASDNASGWVVGLQGGYDYQLANQLVLGVETDIQWSDLKSSHQATTTGSSPLFATLSDTSQSLEWFGTTRARVGYSIGRVLPYATGGVAYGGVETRGAQVLVAGLVSSGYRKSTPVGWTVGAGLEIALSARLSARAEYLYLQLPGVTGPAIGVATAPAAALPGSFSTGSLDMHIVRGGMNYRFNGSDGLGFNGLGNLLSASEGGLFAMLFPKPSLDWSGFYGGVNGGYGGGVVEAFTAFAQPGLFFSTNTSNRASGAVAGGQIGYNRQFANQIVLGAESDAQWSGVKARHQATTVGGPGGFVFTDTSNGMTWFGTTRLRAGLALGNSLSYVTGGVAYGEVTAAGTQIAGGLFTGAGARTRIGWTVGSGAERDLGGNLSLKGEYLYVNFSGVSGPAVGLGATPFAGGFSSGRFGAHITRIGLNWRFGGAAPAQVMAKF